MLNKFFDQIYLLNLKKDKRRLINSVKVSKLVNFRFKKFEAEHWSSPSVKKIIYKKKLNNNEHLTPGAIGCSYSHIKIIEDAIKNNYENILILEDDILPHVNFKEILTRIYLPDNYKFLYLGGNLDGRTKFLKKYNDVYFKSENIAGTFSWAINKTIFKECINEISLYNDTADRSLARLHSKYKDDTYILKEHLFLPNVFEGSNIRNILNSEFSINWFKRMGFSRKDIHPKFLNKIPDF